jgi:hypothetical protein
VRAALALLATAALLAACEPGSRVDKPVAAAPPSGPHLDLVIEAPKDTHYQMLCQVRTYQVAPGQYANRYGVDTTGPYKDTILSPNADCNAEIVTGPAPVKITLSKPGTTTSATIDTPGPTGKTKLLVF